LQVSKGGDVCEELRNNLKLEREAKEKLSRENQRLIKEIVEMNVNQEKKRLGQECDESRTYDMASFRQYSHKKKLITIFTNIKNNLLYTFVNNMLVMILTPMAFK
jgi:hypothetical protein